MSAFVTLAALLSSFSKRHSHPDSAPILFATSAMSVVVSLRAIETTSSPAFFASFLTWPGFFFRTSGMTAYSMPTPS